MENQVVCYFRVSTRKQGLGIEAQRQAVAEFLSQHPEISVIGEFTEKHTGKQENRPEFQKAVELCRRSGATLLSAKLDRIGRGKFLYTMLGDSTFKFRALDITGTSELERSIKVALSIEEGITISARTSAGLQAKANILNQAREFYHQGEIERARELVYMAENFPNTRVKRGFEWWVERDFKLGNKRASESYTEAERAERARLRAEEADTTPENVRAKSAIEQYLADGGARNFSAIARFLNDNHYKTRRGKSGWRAQSVKNLMERFGL